MSSLVSDFIINPVLRQARRFSAGFAADEPPRLQQHRRTGSAGDSGSAANAILETDDDHSDAALTDDPLDAAIALRRTEAAPSDPPVVPNPPSRHVDGLRATLENTPSTGLNSGTDPRPSQRPHTSSSDTVTSATPQATWPLIEASRSTPLPEDDGMGELRRRIHAIRVMDAPQDTKAQMVHQLLMEKYNTSQQPSGAALAAMRPESPSGRSVSGPLDSSEASGPLQALNKFWHPLGDGSAPLNLPLTEEDLKPSYAPSNVPVDGAECCSGQKESEDGEECPQHLGCEHYRRNVKLQCASCERWYPCRFCHDAVEDHVLPRQQTKHMLCMLCGCAQKASDSCIGCGQSAAYYYCGICKLWNDDPNKSIYHCADCGLCRVGQGLGKDFFHCKKCMACISLGGDHKCIERSTDCDCPICSDYLFNSPKPVVFMQCGHSIHRHCFEEHMKSSYKCPLCNKSCVNMEYQFRNYDMAILTQPMPAEYCDTRAIISCNDCRAKSQTAYHWLGLKCTVCQSYNTTQLQLLNMPGVENAAPENPETLQQHQQPAPLDAAFLTHQLRQRSRAASIARRERERQQIERDQAAASAAALSSSPSYSPAFLFRLLHRTAASISTPSVSSAEDQHGAAPSSPPPPPQGRGPIVASSPSARSYGGLTAVEHYSDDDDEEEDDEDDDDMLDLFWGRDRDYERGNAITSAESAVGLDDEDEEGESSSEEEEEEDCDEDEEEEEEEEGIMLVGHR